MILLSFDIGIKNLAYSVVKCENNTLQTVYDTGIVNLIDTQQTGTTCHSKVKPTGCKNRANHSIGRGDQKILLCGNKSCHQWGFNEWVSKHPKSKATIQKYKQKKATQYSLINMGSAMKVWIEEKQKVWSEANIEITDVLLEHQPVFRNPVMKSVQMILVGILVGTGFHTTIHFVHAKQKTSKQDSYAQRKKASIEIIEELMKETPDAFPERIINIWRASRKRDDVADTITQALAWQSPKG